MNILYLCIKEKVITTATFIPLFQGNSFLSTPAQCVYTRPVRGASAGKADELLSGVGTSLGGLKGTWVSERVLLEMG